MKRFDRKGMMIFPNPEGTQQTAKMDDLLVIGQCFCPNGHNLVTEQAVFNDFNGIMVKVKQADEEGLVAINPVYGFKQRISLGIKLQHDQLLEITCPECGIALPVYSACSCGGNLVTLFLDAKPDFTNSVLICNRVDCHHSQIRLHNEMVHYDGMGHVMFR